MGFQCVSFDCLPAWNNRREDQYPHVTLQEQPYRFKETNNTSTLGTCVMTRIYLNIGLSASSALLCLVLYCFLKFVKFLRQLNKTFA